ncbi:MAG: sigma-70 family RNA polymerase sigma factor [Planctomycetota bacterium]
MALSCEQLFVAWAERGDVDALGALFDRESPLLLGLARHLAPAADAEDVVQETFLTAIEKARSYDRSLPLEPWLVGILTRHARRAQRRARRRADAKRLPERTVPDPAVQAAEVERQRALEHAIGALPGGWRAALMLRLDGVSPAEIAFRLGRPSGTVRSDLSRALAWLRSRLAGAGALGVAVPTELAPMREAVLARALATRAATPASLFLGALMTHRAMTTVGAALLLGVAGSILVVPHGVGHGGAGEIDRAAAPRAATSAAVEVSREPTAYAPDPTVSAARRRHVIEVMAATRPLWRGRCVSAATGEPVAGAAVTWHPQPPSAGLAALRGGAGGWPVPEPVSTDRDGWFAIVGTPPPRAVEVRVDHERFATHRQWMDPDAFAGPVADATAPTIELRPGARLTGHVVDARGNPVQLTHLDIGDEATVEVAADGSFDHGGLAVGRHQIRVAAYEARLRSADHVEVAAPGAALDITVVVDAQPVLHGVVTDTTGAPVPDVPVRIPGAREGELAVESTDHRGRFRFISADRRVRPLRLTVDAHPYRVVRGDGVARFGEAAREIVLDRGGQRRVAVQDAAGRPVTDYCVLCEPAPADLQLPLLLRHGEPHPGGIATVDGLWPGRYRLKVVPQAPELASSPWTEFRYPPADERPLRVVVGARPMLTATVVDLDGKPVPGVSVELLAAADGSPIDVGSHAHSFRDLAGERRQPRDATPTLADLAKTDAAGQVTLHHDAVDAALWLRVTGAVVPTTMPVPRGTADVTCPVDPGGVVTGVLRAGSNGSAYRHLMFMAGDATAPIDVQRVIRVRRDGRFRSDRLPSGQHALWVWLPEGLQGEAIARVDITPGRDQHIQVDLGAVPLGRARVRQRVAAAGLPAAQMRLVAVGEPPNPDVHGRAQGDGWFEFEALPGQYVAQFSYHGDAVNWLRLLVWAQPIEIRAGETTELEFAFPTQTLEVEVVDEHGAPYADELVYVWVGQDGAGCHGGTILSDAHGIATMDFAPQGRAVVSLDSRRTERAELQAPWSPPRARMRVMLRRKPQEDG